MEVYKYNYNINDFDTPLETLLSEDALLFDIETTGLSRDHCSIYLIGCGYRKGVNITMTLLFAPTYEAEAEIIKAFLDLCGDFSSLLSFNGESFDIPFVRTRGKKMGLDCSRLNEIRSMDLFKLTKKYSKYLNTPDCKQKTIEQYYGLYRKDQYNGGQLIDIYKEYCINPDPKALDTLLLHNHEDVKGMLTVLNILQLQHIHDAASDSAFNLSHLDVSKTGELIFCIDMKLNQDITISDFYHVISLKPEGIRVILHPINGELKHFYPNYRDYRYIPNEDLLIPKALASTIDKNRIQKATKENCFTRHSGVFVPVTDEKGHSFYDASDEITYRISHDHKQQFIEADPSKASQNFWLSYISALIKYVI